MGNGIKVKNLLIKMEMGNGIEAKDLLIQKIQKMGDGIKVKN